MNFLELKAEKFTDELSAMGYTLSADEKKNIRDLFIARNQLHSHASNFFDCTMPHYNSF